MVNQDDYRKQTGVYLYEGKLYRILSFCSEPSLEMIGISNGDIKSFGVTGLMNDNFKRLPNLKYDHVIDEVVMEDG